MPAVNYRGGGGSSGRRGSGYRSLPVWLQWLLPFSVAAALVAALVIFVNYETNDTPAQANYNSPAAVAEQSREDRILVEQQQAPHRARLKPGRPAAAAARGAVVAYMAHQIARGIFDGPITRASCRPAAGSTSGRQVFHCDVTASALAVTYPFDGVVQTAAGVITFCQRVAPPLPSMTVPVSKRCT